jgi:hypothetical protein
MSELILIRNKEILFFKNEIKKLRREISQLRILYFNQIYIRLMKIYKRMELWNLFLTD